jgi:RNA polymerase sigma-70 factor (ECF subfamily)
MPNTQVVSQQECSPTAVTDAVLVERTRQGDQSAFAQLVARYEQRLLRVIGRMISDRDLVRDVGQEAFLRAYERLDQFDSARRFGPWLFRIAVNLCVDLLRRRRRTALVVFSDAPANKPPEAISDDTLPERELAEEVRHVLEQIPVKYRTVLVLRDLEGFSCSEVAAIVNRREPTVRWRLARAREIFRRQWLARNPSTQVAANAEPNKVRRHDLV